MRQTGTLVTPLSPGSVNSLGDRACKSHQESPTPPHLHPYTPAHIYTRVHAHACTHTHTHRGTDVDFKAPTVMQMLRQNRSYFKQNLHRMANGDLLGKVCCQQATNPSYQLMERNKEQLG